jgi:glycerol uptake facilitator-like aquaporin
MGLASWGSLWVYFVANFAAGVAAAAVFKVINPEDK